MCSWYCARGMRMDELDSGCRCVCMQMNILSSELGVFGGLITLVCSYILSESILCHSTVVWGFPLCCIVLMIWTPYQPICPGAQLVEHSPRKRIPPRVALLFYLEKRVVLGTLDLFALSLPCYLIGVTCMYIRGVRLYKCLVWRIVPAVPDSTLYELSRLRSGVMLCGNICRSNLRVTHISI